MWVVRILLDFRGYGFGVIVFDVFGIFVVWTWCFVGLDSTGVCTPLRCFVWGSCVFCFFLIVVLDQRVVVCVHWISDGLFGIFAYGVLRYLGLGVNFGLVRLVVCLLVCCGGRSGA